MPVVKANQPLPTRQPVILIFGEPGVCKTSIGNTCEKPLVIDFDRGIDRSIFRKDTLQVSNWDEIVTEEGAGTFKDYSTVVIDTAKAALDDYLMNYVVAQDYKLKTNKLGMYGAIGDQFKIFINARRSENAAIFIVAHAKKDEDTKKNVPDVTGQSYQLLLRIADQVGYVSIKNGKRVLTFEPSDSSVGKNVAGLSEISVPDKTDPAFRTFGADLVNKVREAIAAMSEEQREAVEKSSQYQEQIASCETSELIDLLGVISYLPDYLRLPLMQLVYERFANEMKNCGNVDAFNTLFGQVNELADQLKAPLRTVASEAAKSHGWTPNKETKKFEAPVLESNEETTPSTEENKQGQTGTGSETSETKKSTPRSRKETATA